jgi:hypothetical protein
MFGYRLFKVLGSLLILLLTQWLPWSIDDSRLAGAGCVPGVAGRAAAPG